MKWQAVVASCALGLVACSRPTRGGHTEVAASSSALGLAKPPPDAGATRIEYTFASSGESKLGFTGVDVTGKHVGSFATFSGNIKVLNGSPEEASVTVDIDLSSLSMDDAKLTTELKSKQFFDVERFPRAHFSSTSVENGGALGATDTVKGTLELHGKSHAIEIPGTLHVRPNGVDVDAEFKIRRRDFGLRFSGKRDALVEDEVTLELLVVATPTPTQ